MRTIIISILIGMVLVESRRLYRACRKNDFVLSSCGWSLLFGGVAWYIARDFSAVPAVLIAIAATVVYAGFIAFINNQVRAKRNRYLSLRLFVFKKGKILYPHDDFLMKAYSEKFLGEACLVKVIGIEKDKIKVESVPVLGQKFHFIPFKHITKGERALVKGYIKLERLRFEAWTFQTLPDFYEDKRHILLQEGYGIVESVDFNDGSAILNLLKKDC